VGANSRRRRAAKQRRRRQSTGDQNAFKADPGHDAASAYADVDLAVLRAIGRLGGAKVSDAELWAITEAVRQRIRPHPSHVLETVLAVRLESVAADVQKGGWEPADLRELIRRHAGARFMGVLDAVLDNGRPRLDTTAAQAGALRVTALLSRTPRLEASTLVGTLDGEQDVAAHPKLARVRALLAKAESTEYDEEAEALSAKAQELITKYALERFVDQRAGHSSSPGLGVRRLWLDPPYVEAKAALVHEVAQVNSCRSVVTPDLGFCLLIGAAIDLHAIELLVTSLLVQANTAMLRHGRAADRGGTSRTRSFRRSFLLAYAVRIGERLRTAVDSTTAEAPGDLLPVLHDHQERVEQAFSELIPRSVVKRSSLSNWDGWAAGVVAADLAELSVGDKLRPRRVD
jgi:Protein of unknown function (DUF2786)